MIQRIQTVYLLVAAVLMSFTLFMPAAMFSNGESELLLYAFSMKSTTEGSVPNIYLGILLSVATILPLVTIFMYKKRMVQLRFCAAEIVVLLGSCVVYGVYYYLGTRFFDGAAQEVVAVKPVIAMPLLALFFMWLALRGVFKDEMTIRSLNRIR